MTNQTTPRTIRIGHSPDPDDAFLFYALAHGKVGYPGWAFEHILKEIETLNQWAFESRLEVTAMSLHAYAHVADRYAILPYGTSVGVKYGPVLISQGPLSLAELKGEMVAVPGTFTTAFALLKMVLPDFIAVVVPFDQIMEVVRQGKVKAGLLIHEGQITYREQGFHPIVDFGVWWQETTGLPLPLGVNCIRKDMGEDTIRIFNKVFQDSIGYGMAHRDDAITYAMQYGRGLARDLTDRFVHMYVNQYAIALGDDGRQGIRVFLEKLHGTGLVKRAVSAEIVADAV